MRPFVFVLPVLLASRPFGSGAGVIRSGPGPFPRGLSPWPGARPAESGVLSNVAARDVPEGIRSGWGLVASASLFQQSREVASEDSDGLARAFSRSRRGRVGRAVRPEHALAPVEVALGETGFHYAVSMLLFGGAMSAVAWRMWADLDTARLPAGTHVVRVASGEQRASAVLMVTH